MSDDAPDIAARPAPEPGSPHDDLTKRLAEIDQATDTLTRHAERLADAEAVDDLKVIRDATARLGDLLSTDLPAALSNDDPAALSQVRHEVHNHLNHIIGLSELIAESDLLGGDAEAALDLATLRRSGGGFLDLVRERLTGPSASENADLDDGPVSSMADPDPAPELEPTTGSEANRFAEPSSPTRDFEAFVFTRPERRNEVTPITSAEPEDLAEPEPVVERRVEPCDILVIDDDKINRATLGRWVEQLGHRVYQAEGGARGLSMVKDGHFDLVLLDVLMPDMNGYEFLGVVKQDPDNADIPVIMISGLDEIDSVARCIELGAEDYLAKPFNPVLLRARIQACLEKKRLRDEASLRYSRLRRDLAAARALQASMLPASMPVSTPELPITADAFMEAARDLSGDFYDIFPLGGGEIGFVVGDGAKKGVAAALFMARAMSLIRMSTARWSDTMRTPRSPADTLNEVNAALARGNVELMYATMFMGVLDTTTGMLRYCGAGHVPPLRFGPKTPAAALEVQASLPLGMGEAPYYEDQEAQLVPGEAIFVFTDGVTDALDPAADAYSTERLRRDLDGLGNRSVKRIIQGVRDRLGNFMQGTQHHDDMTALCLRWDGPPST